MMTRVACIGDSLTWGFSLPDPRRQSYPALLQERLGEDYAVRNFGCNGASVRREADLPYVATLAYGESRAWNPDIVLLMLGSNDATPWDWDAAAFRRDYERLVASYRELPLQPRVILIAPIRMFRVFDRNNDFWRILDLLDRYYKGTASDYETEHLTWRLYLGVENYLKAYCPSIDGSGLADTISELQRMGVLPDRYIPNRIGTVEEELRRITGMVIFKRNYIAHNLNHGHDDESSLCDSIKIAIRFYLLVAAYGATKICH